MFSVEKSMGLLLGFLLLANRAANLIFATLTRLAGYQST